MESILTAYNEIPAMAIETGYQMKTTFWGDFTVAERLDGINGVLDTFKRAFENWNDDKEMATEMALVLNWKIWQHADNDDKLAKCYNDCWRKIDGYIVDNWKGEMLDYYLATTD